MLDGAGHVLAAVVHGEHHHLQQRPQGLGGPQHLNPVGAGHLQIEHQHIGVGMPAHERQGRVAVGGFAQHFESGLAFEDAADAAAHQRVIIGQQHPHDLRRHHRPPTGMRASSRTPPSGAVPRSSRPP